MRFLIDECLSAGLVELLLSAGHDAAHVNDQALAGQPDDRVLAAAVSDARVLISADTDFGEILARTIGATQRILFRRSDRSAASLAQVLLANLDTIADDLDQGAFVVITEDRIRIRRLPMG